MTVSASMVKDLRVKSGAGIMECKEALKESEGDLEAALDFLRKKGAAKAAKKADRSTKEGSVAGASDGKVAALIEIKCETDFVARNDKFQAFCKSLAEHTQAAGPGENDEAFLAQPFASNTSISVKEAIEKNVHEVGENIVVGRRVSFELSGAGAFGLYIHAGGAIGALVELGCGKEETVGSDAFATLAKDIAMQVAASPATVAVTSDDLPVDVVEREKSIFEAQAKESGKPDKIIPKIVEGMTKKFFKEACLVDQVFVKDTDKTIDALLKESGKAMGDEISVRRFSRLQLGE